MKTAFCLSSLATIIKHCLVTVVAINISKTTPTYSTDLFTLIIYKCNKGRQRQVIDGKEKLQFKAILVWLISNTESAMLVACGFKFPTTHILYLYLMIII